MSELRSIDSSPRNAPQLGILRDVGDNIRRAAYAYAFSNGHRRHEFRAAKHAFSKQDAPGVFDRLLKGVFKLRDGRGAYAAKEDSVDAFEKLASGHLAKCFAAIGIVGQPWVAEKIPHGSSLNLDFFMQNRWLLILPNTVFLLHRHGKHRFLLLREIKASGASAQRSVVPPTSSFGRVQSFFWVRILMMPVSRMARSPKATSPQICSSVG
jgi:hypothetical protein